MLMKKNKYLGSIVLGLNDALVEMTGAIAGMTLLLSSTRIIALTAGVTGFAAALSMAASEYLEVTTEQNGKDKFKATAYTGGSYMIAVILLVFPFFVIPNRFIALTATVIIALSIIAIFIHYASRVQKTKFWRRFAEMAIVSMGIAAITFVLGLFVKRYLL